MGLIASGVNLPNFSNSQLVSSAGFGVSTTSVVLGILDCRNFNGITIPALTPGPGILGQIPTLAVTGGSPYLRFVFVSDIDIVKFIPNGSTNPTSNLKDTTLPASGAPSISFGNTAGAIAYPYINGASIFFGDVVPVLGPYCIVLIDGNNATANFTTAAISMTLAGLANTRAYYDSILKGALVTTTFTAVATGGSPTNTIGLMTSGLWYVSGSSSGGGAATQSVNTFSLAQDTLTNAVANNFLARQSNDAAAAFTQIPVVFPRGIPQIQYANSSGGTLTATLNLVKGNY